MIGLYSVNLHVMGKANVGLLQETTLFTLFESFGLTVPQAGLVVGLLFAVVVGVIIYWFFGTEIGTAVRATGSTPRWPARRGSTRTA